MKRELFAGVVAVTVMSLPGTAAAEPTSQPVPPDKIDSIILSQDDVSAIVGATMVDEKSFPKPDPPEDVDKSECAVLFDMNSDSFGDDHEAFKANVQKDSKGDDFADHTVIQQVAIYSDTDTPAKLFQTVFQSASSCTSLLRPKGGNVDWQAKTPPAVSRGEAQWTLSAVDANGNPFGFRCAHDVRVQSNVMLEAVLCQWGNPIKIATQLADRMTASFSA